MTTPTTDLTIPLANLKPLAAEVNAWLETVRGFVIDDEETLMQLTDMRSQLQRVDRKLKAMRMHDRQPYADVVKSIDALYKAPAAQCAEALGITKTKLDEHARQQLVIEREHKRIAREAADKQAKELADAAQTIRDSGAADTADEIEKQATKVVEKAAAPAKVEPVRAKQSTLVTVRRWKAKVFDVKALALAVGRGKVPVTVLQVRQSELDALAREVGAERDADGFTIYEHVSTQTK